MKLPLNAFKKLPPEAQELLDKLPLPLAVGNVFDVHGKKNPEGGIRRPREHEYAEVAIKTRYFKGVPDNLSDEKLKDVVNAWVDQNTDWLELKRGPISRWTVRRVRKLPRG
jgi:hypothetical protein